MTHKPHQEKGTLVLALIAGLSVNGAFSALFSSIVPFSIFPLLALILSIYCLHQRYLHHSMPEGIPMLAAASFLLGLLIYSAIVRVEYPAIGSNFIPSILCVVLVFWIGLKLRRRKESDSVSADESETL
ncbi:YijD family membrane protein [Pectobacterium sp. FL60-S17]|uniref:YijD family membrane protein n=1 Tax=Pectobacterium quasiaquaticum TaxID=2774015 RepID=A0A9Q2ESL8_9GAMM|nr:YijD family membrane protein [Pectobacterium quasiaquaticum]MBE5201955.1 YijD family membrane protein [Pectobacterium quasiaquaticum]MBE5211416.1 YijD family membrane protein [Pectobacterium quasiaquaticum]URG49192.1 YijD family membrane protein [Pectobacterium quasiaquaticum]